MSEIHFLNNGDIALDNAKIMSGTYRNFSGAPDTYNEEGGKRYFNVRIDDPEIVDALISRYPEMTIKEKVYEDDQPFWFFKVIINYRYDTEYNINRNPKIRTKKEGFVNLVDHDESTIGELDGLYIIDSDIQFRVANIKRNNKQAAYLKYAYITVENGDYYLSRYSEEETPEE